MANFPTKFTNWNELNCNSDAVTEYYIQIITEFIPIGKFGGEIRQLVKLQKVDKQLARVLDRPAAGRPVRLDPSLVKTTKNLFKKYYETRKIIRYYTSEY